MSRMDDMAKVYQSKGLTQDQIDDIEACWI